MPKFIGKIVMPVVISYLLVAFCALDLSVTSWPVGARMVFLGLSFLGVIFAAVADVNYEDIK